MLFTNLEEFRQEVEARVKKNVVYYSTETKGRKKITRGYDKYGREILTETRSKGFSFSIGKPR